MPLGAILGTPASLSLADAGNERTSFLIYGPVLSAGNFAAQQILWQAVVDQAMDIVLGAKVETRFGNVVPFAWSQPTNGAAREIALKLSLVDVTTGQKMTAALGTIDPDLPDYVVNINAKDVVQMSSPSVIVDFITAVNAFARNPYTGNAMTVKGIRVARGQK